MYLRRGSGYYIDVGASELIANGSVALRSPVGVESIGERSVRLSDGSELPADLIVYATGYGPMSEWAARLISPAVAERVMNEQLRATGYGVFARRLFDEMFIVSSDPKLKATIMDRALQLRSEIGGTLFPRMVGWDARRMEAALAAVRVPFMVIQSTTMNAERIRVSLSSSQSSPWLDLVKSRAPTARIEIIPGVGHFPQLEAPAKVNALLADFASKLSA